jgi:pilus assembly protein CpaB
MTRTATRTALGALGVALLAALLLLPQLTRRAGRLTDGTVRSVVVLTRDLARGASISRTALDFRDLPERYLEERHIEAHDLERVLGARAAAALPTGSVLLWSDLDLAAEGRSLAGLVRAGKRAFTLPAGDLGFTGLLRPGDRVDVLFTPGDGDTVTLLQNVLVLTVGSDLGAAAEGYDAPAGAEDRPVGAATRQASDRVTLSVDLEQAQHLAASEGRGALRLALRNPLDLALVDAPPPTASGGQSLAAPSGQHGGAP